MSSDTLFADAHLLLPEVFVAYFEMAKHEIKGVEMHVY